MVRQAYTGNVFLAADNPSIIQQVITAVPNKGASNPALSGTCRPDSTTAVLVANANPGDSLTFSWKLAPFVSICELIFSRSDSHGYVFQMATQYGTH